MGKIGKVNDKIKRISKEDNIKQLCFSLIILRLQNSDAYSEADEKQNCMNSNCEHVTST